MRTVDRSVPPRHEAVLVMPTTVIVIDPHKRSHTAVVLDGSEQIEPRVQVTAERRQVDRQRLPLRAGCRMAGGSPEPHHLRLRDARSRPWDEGAPEPRRLR